MQLAQIFASMNLILQKIAKMTAPAT